ncbi:MAG: sugar transferase [Lachnospiraceae bacterium]|nr:sugar transferase [Lachnospiraceae bacterium]
MYRKIVKRLLDILLSGLVLLLFSWLYLILCVLVRVKLGSPVFFSQERPGFKGRIFRLYKFRTMTDARGADGELLPDEERLTRFGRLLRSTSLDELPEFFNILKGDMSFVGPRPLLVKYLPWYSEEEMRRHDVRPGLTGLAQVNGRNALNWEKRFAYDVHYVDHCSFLLDLKIAFMTVGKVIVRDGVLSGAEMVTTDFDIYRKEQLEHPDPERGNA